MVRIDDSGGRTKCWLSRDELDRLERTAGAGAWKREVAIQLMGRCGLRASEVSYPAYEHLRWSEDGECWMFEVRGKNISSNGPNIRYAWMPDSIQDDIRKFSRERGLSPCESWVRDVAGSIRRWVKWAAHEIADETGDERWREVSSHDLRRSWATYHLVERQVDVRTMMSIGGWSDYSAIEPYLAEPTESRIGEAMQADG